MDGQSSRHGGNSLVPFAGVVQYSAKYTVGVWILCDPYPGALDKVGSQLWSAGFQDGSVSLGLAALGNHGAQADVLCHFGARFESFGVEDFESELCGDDRTDAGMCFQRFDGGGVTRVIQDFVLLLLGSFDLTCEEIEFAQQGIETKTQLGGQLDFLQDLDCGMRPGFEARRLRQAVLEQETLYLELDAFLFIDQLFTEAGYLAVGFLLFCRYGDGPQESLGRVFGELSAVEAVGLGVSGGLPWGFGGGNHLHRKFCLLQLSGEAVSGGAGFVGDEFQGGSQFLEGLREVFVVGWGDEIDGWSIVEPDCDAAGLFVDVDADVDFVVFGGFNLLEPHLFFR